MDQVFDLNLFLDGSSDNKQGNYGEHSTASLIASSMLGNFSTDWNSPMGPMGYSAVPVSVPGPQNPNPLTPVSEATTLNPTNDWTSRMSYPASVHRNPTPLPSVCDNPNSVNDNGWSSSQLNYTVPAHNNLSSLPENTNSINADDWSTQMGYDVQSRPTHASLTSMHENSNNVNGFYETPNYTDLDNCSKQSVLPVAPPSESDNNENVCSVPSPVKPGKKPAAKKLGGSPIKKPRTPKKKLPSTTNPGDVAERVNGELSKPISSKDSISKAELHSGQQLTNQNLDGIALDPPDKDPCTSSRVAPDEVIIPSAKIKVVIRKALEEPATSHCKARAPSYLTGFPMRCPEYPMVYSCNYCGRIFTSIRGGQLHECIKKRPGRKAGTKLNQSYTCERM